MMDPKVDTSIPKEVRTLLIAADAAANSGKWDRSTELLNQARELTAKLADSQNRVTLP